LGGGSVLEQALYRVEMRAVRNGIWRFSDSINYRIEYTLDQGIRKAVWVVVAIGKVWISVWRRDSGRIAKILLHTLIDVEVAVHDGDSKCASVAGKDEVETQIRSCAKVMSNN